MIKYISEDSIANDVRIVRRANASKVTPYYRGKITCDMDVYRNPLNECYVINEQVPGSMMKTIH